MKDGSRPAAENDDGAPNHDPAGSLRRNTRRAEYVLVFWGSGRAEKAIWRSQFKYGAPSLWGSLPRLRAIRSESFGWSSWPWCLVELKNPAPSIVELLQRGWNEVCGGSANCTAQRAI